MFEAKLVVVGGETTTQEVDLHLPTVIGRGREVNLTLPHELVSRRHCEIYEKDGRLVVKDLGSLNGTFVNNTRIEGEQILEPSQLLTLGTVTFRAVYEIDASASRATENGVENTEKLMETVTSQPASGSLENESAPVLVDSSAAGSNEMNDAQSGLAAPLPVEAPPSDKETVYDQSKKEADTDCDLDQSIKELREEIVSGSEDEEVQIEQAVAANPVPRVSMSSLEGLPQVSAEASLVGEIRSGPDQHHSALNDDEPEPGSFLRNLPR